MYKHAIITFNVTIKYMSIIATVSVFGNMRFNNLHGEVH